jgi:hypothetical protein|tara:strand:+ start:762 stop:944 length:183 start_codon:yes stop_codon:yes gene_type:complete
MDKKQKYSEVLKDIEKWESLKLKKQGRSNRQVENNYKILEWVTIGFISFIIITFIIHLVK